jgi:hypothetical protein
MASGLEIHMTSTLKKSLAGGLAGLTLITALTVSATPAAAWWRGGWGWGAPAVAAGVIGGLAVGSAIAASNRPYYGPGYYYEGGPVCHPARVPVYDAYGAFAGYRMARVCE